MTGVTGSCPQLASLGLCTWDLSHGPQEWQEQANPGVQAHFKSLLASAFSCPSGLNKPHGQTQTQEVETEYLLMGDVIHHSEKR